MKCDTQHNDTEYNRRALFCRVPFMLSVNYAQCHIQALYAECRYADCSYGEGYGAVDKAGAYPSRAFT